MTRVTVNNGDIEVAVAGTGHPLVFVHGFPLDHTMWEHQIRHFSQHLRVIAPDLRGFGKSPERATPGNLADDADDLAHLLDALNITQPITLCGLSMGGYIAWQFFQRHRDRLHSLIQCDTKAATDTPEARRIRFESAERVLAEGPAFLAEGMPGKLFGKATFSKNPVVIEETIRVIRETASPTIAHAQHAMAGRPDVTNLLGKIDVPTLLIVGEEDQISPPQEMREMAVMLPDSQLVVIPEAGHMAPLEAPEAVNAAIEAFLRRVGVIAD